MVIRGLEGTSARGRSWGAAARDRRDAGRRPRVPVCAALVALSVGCTYVPDRQVVDARTGSAMSPTLAASGARTLKRKVAIGRFTNETLYGRSVLLDDVDKQGDVIGKRTSDILATRLTETDKFLLFERIDADKLWSEIETSGGQPKQVPVDYLILGSVTEFGRETVGESGFLTRTKTQKAHARVSLRLVDVRTSRIVYSEEGSGEAISEVGTVAGVGTRAGYDSTLNDKAISAAISKLISNLVENLLERPWQSAILQVDGDEVYVAGGKSQGLEKGDRLAVHERGKVVKNPQTGIDMELPGPKVATLEVVGLFGSDPMEEGSICRVADGELPEGSAESLVVKEDRS
jgi:curli biogenesis system outer membrane secretion channel CsgG